MWPSHQSEYSNLGKDGQHWSDICYGECFRTRHVDTRYHFVREFIEDGFIRIEFVRSAENDSDLFTKTVGQELYERHTKKFLEKNRNYYTIWRLMEVSLMINHLALYA
jgi:hypothetical protein